MSPHCLFVEVLNLSILWRIWRRRCQLAPADSQAPLFVLYEATSASKRLARWLGFKVQVLQFDFWDEVRLSDGSHPAIEVFERSPGEIIRQLENQPAYRQAVRSCLRSAVHEPYALAFLAKRLGYELGAGIRTIVTAGWYARKQAVARAILAYRQGYPSELLREYAASQGVQIEGILSPLDAGMETLLSASPSGGLKQNLLKSLRIWARKGMAPPAPSSLPQGRALVAAEMYLNGTQTQGPFSSDLFWYQAGAFAKGDVVAYFRHPKDQPKGERAARLKEQGLLTVDRFQLAGLRGSLSRSVSKSAGAGSLEKTVSGFLSDFYQEYDLWVSFCKATGCRIHVSMYKQFPENEPKHAAFRDAGGLSVTIQRSVERHPHLFRRTVCDLHLAHTQNKLQVEKESGSLIEKFMVTGYPFDFAFDQARQEGARLRERLAKAGVRFVVCYLDQNEGSHRKTMGGQSRIRQDYGFLIEQAESDSTLGLVFKPKRPETLSHRLGEALEGRLQALVGSGRCILIEREDSDRSALPCVASSAADVSVNLLYGGTAGLESWLCGTPTLLLSALGAVEGVFGRLPKHSVVFESWPELWVAVTALRQQPTQSHLGNWGPIIDEFALMRDGRAAQRIGRVVAVLQRHLREGKTPEQALDVVTQEYQKQESHGLAFAR